MRVTVDEERCHGHQMCAIAAPEVFGSDDYGNAVVLITGPIPASSRRRCDVPRATVPNAPSSSRTTRRIRRMSDRTVSTGRPTTTSSTRVRQRPVSRVGRSSASRVPGRPHRAVGRLVDADAVRRHRRRRPGARRFTSQQILVTPPIGDLTQSPYGGVAAPPITSDPPEHHWAPAPDPADLLARSRSPSTSRTRATCATS